MTLVTLYIILSVFNLRTQQSDNQAIQILDKFSEKALSSSSVSMKFNVINTDQAEKISDTLPGNIIISKEKYKLELPDNIIWFNGKTSWSYLPVESEVTITEPGDNDDSFQNNPSAIFTTYKKGYKCRLVEETAKNYIIDLYPEDLHNALMRIRITLEKSNLALMSLEHKRKDGRITTINIQNYDLTQTPTSDSFVFNKSEKSDVEVIDMR